MDRRTVLGNLALGTVALSGATAQPSRAMARIGILRLDRTSDMAGAQPQVVQVNALLRGLQELGYRYGEDFVTEPRGAAGKPQLVASLAAELVRARVDVIVAAGPTLGALKQATSTIPVVMGGASDPVGEELVQSLARPGRNFTGLSLQTVETIGKRIELLKELDPGAAPVAVLWDRPRLADWQAAEQAAQARQWRLLSLEIRAVSEIERAIERARAGGAATVLVLGGGIFLPHARRIADLVARNRLAAVYPLRLYVEDGGLMSYGPDVNDIWRRAAGFVDKILRGARPAELPVEQPTKFELVINLKAAKSIGLTIPAALSLRADDLVR